MTRRQLHYSVGKTGRFTVLVRIRDGGDLVFGKERGGRRAVQQLHDILLFVSPHDITHVGFNRISHVHISNVLRLLQSVSNLLGREQRGGIPHFLLNRLSHEKDLRF